MDFRTRATRRAANGSKPKESLFQFLWRGGRIEHLDYEPGPRQLEFPIRPKGRQMPGQPDGCLKVPDHGGF